MMRSKKLVVPKKCGSDGWSRRVDSEERRDNLEFDFASKK